MITETLVGLGITAFLLLYLAFKLEDKHQVIKVLSVFFALYLILLIGKTTLDEKDYCELKIRNETVDGNVTSYEYDRVCVTNLKTTANTFYWIDIWYIRLVYVYLIGFVTWLVLNYIVQVVRGGGK